jgi:XTP/dITP diphosphohydrolase
VSDRLRVVLATRNAGKAREFGRLLGQAVLVETLPPEIDMPPETGSRFDENARIKAEGVADVMGRLVTVLADDSGLQVDCLDGRPGVLSARYAGEAADDEHNVTKLLGEMRGVTSRQARFVCCLCLVPSDELCEGTGVTSLEVSGVSEGEIVDQPRGEDGFGYDPVFRPKGWKLTLAEAAPDDKDRVSHRGAATRELIRRMGELGLLRPTEG